MVILGITGSLAAGKETAVRYFQSVHNFIVLQVTESLQSLLDQSSSEDLMDNKKKISQLLSEINENPKKNYIIYPISSLKDLSILRSTPIFFLLGIDSPIQLRYRNYVKKHGKPKNQLQGFLSLDDDLRFYSHHHECLISADRIVQNISTLEAFSLKLSLLDLLNFEHTRPSTDLYYIRMAELVSSRSGCSQHKGGCILTNRNRIVSTGYSGIPKGTLQCIDGGCEVCFYNLGSECVCQHGEMNAIIEGKAHKVRGGVLYTNLFPCIWCVQCIIQVKIKKIFYSNSSTKSAQAEARLVAAGIELTQLNIVV